MSATAPTSMSPRLNATLMAWSSVSFRPLLKFFHVVSV